MLRWLRRRPGSSPAGAVNRRRGAHLRDHGAQAYGEARERDVNSARREQRPSRRQSLLRVRANVVTGSTTTKLARPPDPPPVAVAEAQATLLPEAPSISSSPDATCHSQGALLSGSIARQRSSGVDRFHQSATYVGPGPGFFEAVFHCPARRLERCVKFVAGIASCDSYDGRGAFECALVEMACHDYPRVLYYRGEAPQPPRPGDTYTSLRRDHPGPKTTKDGRPDAQ
jgi:hypothetical protein